MLVFILNPLRKYLFSWLPVQVVRGLAYLPTGLLWALLRLGFGKISYFRLIERFSFAHLHHIVFDQMRPKIANYWRKEEVEALMCQADLKDIRLEWVNEMSWAAIGTKQA